MWEEERVFAVSLLCSSGEHLKTSKQEFCADFFKDHPQTAPPESPAQCHCLCSRCILGDALLGHIRASNPAAFPLLK